MLPTSQPNAVSGPRKIGPTAKLPAAVVLKSLSARDRRLVRRRVTEPVECMFDPMFDEPGSVESLFTMTAHCATGDREMDQRDANDDSGVNLLGDERAESPQIVDERHTFLWLNYCRYRAMRVLEEHSGQRLSAAAVSDLLKWEHAANQAREEIVRSNIPLVLAMAKRTRVSKVDFSDLVSEGNMALLRSVDKFDCGRGYRFSTYACRAILKSFSRVASRAARYRGHFPTEFDPTLEKGDQIAQKRVDTENGCVDELKTILGKNLADLTAVEERVIRARFSLDGAAASDPPLHHKTLEQVGEMIGVTKERVRQIQNKALSKLRLFLEGELTDR